MLVPRVGRVDLIGFAKGSIGKSSDGSGLGRVCDRDGGV